MTVDDDYGFVSGKTSWEESAKDLLSLRLNTTRIPRKKRRTTVRHFLRYLKNDGSIDRPIGDLIIVAHANKKAWLKIKMYPGQTGDRKGWTTYETLLEAVSNRKILIHSSLSERDSDDPPMFFHILGCNIGKARPFISKLKEALGGVAIVTAPKHTHSLWDRSSYGGLFEFLKYTFVSGTPTELTTHDQVVDLFKNDSSHRLKDGSAIDESEWDSWVPEDAKVNTAKKIVTARTSPKLGTTINGKKHLRKVSVKYVRWTKRKTYRVRLDADPVLDAARTAALQTHLSTNVPAFTRPDFPEWQVWRFGSLADFVAGFTWSFEWEDTKRKLVCRGVRYEYRISTPILNPSNNQLLFNFYPHPGSGLPHVLDLDLDDSKLFQVV